MVSKTYLRYVPGPESGVVCSNGALSMDAAVLKPNGAPIVAVPALEHVVLWNSRTSEMVAKLIPPRAKPGRTNEVTSVLLVRDPLTAKAWILAAGYASGYVAVWRGRGEDQWECVLYGLSHRPDTAVLSLDVSPDGMTLASGGGDTDITVWDLAADEPLYRLVGHRGGVVGASFVAGARTRTLISAGADGLVKVWNLDVQQCVQTVIASDTQVTAMRIDVAGARLYVGLRDDIVKAYSLEPLRDEALDAAALDNDAEAIVAHGTLKRKIAKPATSIVFSPDKAYLAVTTNRTVEVFRVLSAAEVKKKVQRKKKRRQDKGGATGADAAPPGQKAARSEGADGADAAAADVAGPSGAAAAAAGQQDFHRSVAEELVPLRIYHFQEKIRAVAFVPTKGSQGAVLRFAVATAHNVVDVYDCAITGKADDDEQDDEKPAAQQNAIALGDLKHRLSINSLTHEADVRSLAFSSNNMALVTQSADSIKAWGTRNKAVLRDEDNQAAGDAFEAERRETVALPPDSKLLRCTGTLAGIAAPNDLTGGFVVLPGDHTVIAGTSEGALLIISLLSSEVIERIEAHPPTGITSLALMSEGTVVVSTGKDRRMLKWDVTLAVAKPQGAAAAKKADDDDDDDDAPNMHTNAPPAGAAKVASLMLVEEIELTDVPLVARVTPNNKLIAVAMQDHNVQLLHADTMRPFLTLFGHKLPATAIAFSSDSALCATVGMDKSLRFWGLDFGDCHKAIHAHDDYITDVQFVSDSHYVFTASMDGSIKHWDGDTWTLIQTVRIHQRGVWGLAINADGTFVATAGVDKCIRTLMRTDQLIYPDEESEREAQAAMDEAAIRDAAKQKLDDLSAGADVAAGGHKTVATADAGEHLMEALDVVSIEVQRLNDGAIGQADNALRGASVWTYLWNVIMNIRPSELRHALSSLTAIHVTSLLLFLKECIRNGAVTSFEVAGRVVLAAVKPAPGSNTAPTLVMGDDVDALRMLDELQALVAKGLKAERDRLGRNAAGLAFVQRSIAKHDRVMFHDRSKVQGAKKKYHENKLEAAAEEQHKAQEELKAAGKQQVRK